MESTVTVGGQVSEVRVGKVAVSDDGGGRFGSWMMEAKETCRIDEDW